MLLLEREIGQVHQDLPCLQFVLNWDLHQEYMVLVEMVEMLMVEMEQVGQAR